ncbi:winged helix-turn-helix domain-containing protein [Entomohabitans teleogrylli]|uniref:winged helix-turn-helix domain-containing protein n=1 Tax=Entomohabitans teleogrylli TaxID=1384589 RepID=UPI0013793C46|nr:winged helix-turn-helix domain-containing protein [Entomohabitans teleogrylli]
MLPAPSARLLSELIKTNGTMVTREELLTRVWEDHGYRASNSNLNNYLSILRRNLTALLPESVLITTLPKQGIIFQASVEEISTDETADSAGEETRVPPAPAARRKIARLAALCATGGALLVGALWLVLSPAPQELPARQTFTQAQCRFYLMQDTPLSREDVIATLEKFNITLNCDTHARDVFFTTYDEPWKRRHMAFLAWCQRGEQGKYTRCENIKKISWGMA